MGRGTGGKGRGGEKGKGKFKGGRQGKGKGGPHGDGGSAPSSGGGGPWIFSKSDSFPEGQFVVCSWPVTIAQYPERGHGFVAGNSRMGHPAWRMLYWT